MTVFKGYLKLINRNKGVGLMYFFIFIGITLLLQVVTASDADKGSFQVTSLDMAVVDMDNSVMSQGLIDYLKIDNQVEVTNEVEDEFVELMYYEQLSYVVVIPKGYQEQVVQGNIELNVTKGSSITKGIFGDMSVKGFTNQLYVLSEAGFSANEAVEIAKETSSVKPDVEIVDSSGNGGELPIYYYFLKYIPFLYFGVLCFVIGMVMLEFRNEDIRRRLKCSAVSGVKQGLSGLLAFGLLALFVYLVTVVVAGIDFGKEILEDSNLSLYMINALVLLSTAVSISYLIGVVIKNDSALSGISNVVSLGLCFLGGVFVPLEMLGGVMIKVAKFLPTYWYESNLDILVWHPELIEAKGKILETYYTGIGVQLAMSIVLIIVALAFKRAQNKAE